MMCLMISESSFYVATFILYTTIWIPIQRLRNILAGFLVFLTPHQPISDISDASSSPEPCLPVFRFADLTCEDAKRKTDETLCSICLMDFEGEDVVTQLSKCGHVFHETCIEKWLYCNNFTCPLCRSSFMHTVNADSHAKQHDHHVAVYNPHIPSYLGYSWH